MSVSQKPVFEHQSCQQATNGGESLHRTCSRHQSGLKADQLSVHLNLQHQLSVHLNLQLHWCLEGLLCHVYANVSGRPAVHWCLEGLLEGEATPSCVFSLRPTSEETLPSSFFPEGAVRTVAVASFRRVLFRRVLFFPEGAPSLTSTVAVAMAWPRLFSMAPELAPSEKHQR